MKKLVVIGGSRGLGFSLLNKLYKQYDNVVVLDVVEPLESLNSVNFIKCDLSKDISVYLDEVKDADALILTSGFGVVKPFLDYSQKEIEKTFLVNSLSQIKILRAFYPRLLSKDDVKCFVAGSIAGEVSSPLFSVYGSAKASINKICESLNVELSKNNSNNRITCMIAVSFGGSSFNGNATDLTKLDDISQTCLAAINEKKEKVFINEELCNDIINRYNADRLGFGSSSYDYKIQNGRIDNKRKTVTIGYLSGTFDLFHIGHLNLLKKAKEQCDYLIVGVHESGSWKGKETFIPFEERLAIVNACRYVDEAHVSFTEDSDAWDVYHYDKLFVGSDYKGTERFNRYEEYFKDKGVEIIYFPYTQGTSSTQLREKISKK